MKLQLNDSEEKIVHVVARILKDNLEKGENKPVIGVRYAKDWTSQLYLCRHVDILGSSNLHHTPEQPLPGTDGRGVCVLRTNAPLVLHLDDEQIVQMIADKIGGAHEIAQSIFDFVKGLT